MSVEYPRFPKELISIIDAYWFEGVPIEAKGTLSYLTTKDVIDYFPERVKGIISDYISLSSYQHLATISKLNKIQELEDWKYRLITMPYSTNKAILSIEYKFWPVIIDIFVEAPTLFTPAQTSFLCCWAVESEDYQTALLIIRANPGIAVSSLTTMLIENIDLAERNRSWLARDKRQVDFIINVYSRETDYNYFIFIGCLSKLIKVGWFDNAIKLGNLLPLGDPTYFSFLCRYSELEEEFRRHIRKLVASNRDNSSMLAMVFIRNSTSLVRHKKLLEEERAQGLISAIRKELAGG